MLTSGQRSLAYFAKGPLSRARAAFHLDCDSTLEMNDLIGFLKSLVTSTTVIDKKYRETIPNILSTMKMHIEESEEEDSKYKKRKPKKPKLGKDGLYPSEDADIRRWWIRNKPSWNDEDAETSKSEEAKYLISCLRRRETQLQMILILEILALEPLCRPTDANEDSQLPGMESQTTTTRVTPDPGTKKKKKNDLPCLLDIHADRLCIWQSTTLDHVKSLSESQNPATGQTAQTERTNSDSLKDFCVDVIIPLYVVSPYPQDIHETYHTLASLPGCRNCVILSTENLEGRSPKPPRKRSMRNRPSHQNQSLAPPLSGLQLRRNQAIGRCSVHSPRNK